MNADIMNVDMSVPTRQHISAQQRMSRLKNKIFLSAYRNGDSMTPGVVHAYAGQFVTYRTPAPAPPLVFFVPKATYDNLVTS